jgi:sulfide:quinone oxidoreductase
MSLDQIRQIAPDLYVSPQLQPADMAALAASGIRTIINNRPDNEEPGQPSADTMRQAAEAAGMKYVYLPVVANLITEQDVIAFDAHLRELPAPILAFCRSGNRCSMMWSYVQALRNRV